MDFRSGDWTDFKFSSGEHDLRKKKKKKKRKKKEEEEEEEGGRGE